MPKVFTEDLCRSVQFSLSRATDEPSGDGLTLDGYGAVFGSVTSIDSWEGSFEEVIARGAFKKSLRERTPRIQFDHGHHPLIGSIPIGRVTEIAEDERGLHVVARLSDNWLIEPIRHAIVDGAIDGMSFRFSVVRDEWTDKAGKRVNPADLESLLWAPGDRGPLRRTLKEVKISEVGPVVWPAYETTSVGVRSTDAIDLTRLSEPGQRSLLARAVLMADAAEGSGASSAPRVAEADAHPEQPTGTPQATDTGSAGEHVTSLPRGMRAIDIWVRKSRDTLLTIDQKARASR